MCHSFDVNADSSCLFLAVWVTSIDCWLAVRRWTGCQNKGRRFQQFWSSHFCVWWSTWKETEWLYNNWSWCTFAFHPHIVVIWLKWSFFWIWDQLIHTRRSHQTWAVFRSRQGHPVNWPSAQMPVRYLLREGVCVLNVHVCPMHVQCQQTCKRFSYSRASTWL